MTLEEAAQRVRDLEAQLADATRKRDDMIRDSPESLRAVAQRTGLAFQRVAQIRKG